MRLPLLGVAFCVMATAAAQALPGLLPAEPAWVTLWDGAATTHDDYGGDVVLSPDGTVAFVVGGTFNDATSGDVLALAINVASGSVIWATEHDASAQVSDGGRSAVLSPDGEHLFIAASTAQHGKDLFLTALKTSTGAVAWQTLFGGSSADLPRGLALTPDGSTLLAVVEGTGATEDIVTAAFDAGSGALRWEARLDAGGNDGPCTGCIAASSDGATVYVAGNGFEAGLLVAAYGIATGTEHWNTEVDLGVAADASAMVATQGRVVIAGQAASQFVTVALDEADGALAWMAYQGDGSLEHYAVKGLAASPAGDRVYLTGMARVVPYPFGMWDIVVGAYDAALGLQVWSAQFSGPGGPLTNDLPWAIAVSPDGERVYIAGQTPPIGDLGDPCDMLTLAIDAQLGTVAWAERFGGDAGGPDSAQALAVAPDSGLVVVAGTTRNAATGPDVTVVAYEA